LLRFLRARKFDWEKTKLMFDNFIKWRVDNDVDNVLLSFNFEEAPDVQRYYPHGYHKVDKKGRPIYIERNGLLNIDELFKVTDEGRMVRHYI